MKLMSLAHTRCVGVERRTLSSEAAEAIFGLETSIAFENGGWIRAVFWRLSDPAQTFSSFDDGRRYGERIAFDAVESLRVAITQREVLAVELETNVRDVVFVFAGAITLRVFGFTSYEIWEVGLPDGGGLLSNHLPE